MLDLNLPAGRQACTGATETQMGSTWNVTGVFCLFPTRLGVSRGTWVCVHVFNRTRVFAWRTGLSFLVGRSLWFPVLSVTLSGSYELEPAGLPPSHHSQRPPAKSPECFWLLPQAPPQPGTWATRTHLVEGGMCRIRGKAGGKVGSLGLRPWPRPPTRPGL